VYARVVEELTAGNKRTHWMWFIFPQIAGLGHSPMAEATRFATSIRPSATSMIRLWENACATMCV
jgi:uncharacterized protein (DUF1810 family)